jgi:hypothetical protein
MIWRGVLTSRPTSLGPPRKTRRPPERGCPTARGTYRDITYLRRWQRPGPARLPATAFVTTYLDTRTERAAAPVIAMCTAVLAAADIEEFTATTTFATR